MMVIIILLIIIISSNINSRLTTGWTVRDRIPVETRFSARLDRPWGPPSLLYNGYWVFSENKVAGAWFWQPSPPSAVVQMGRSYTSASPLWLPSHVVGGPLPLPLPLTNGHYILEHTDKLTTPRFWLSLSILFCWEFRDAVEVHELRPSRGVAKHWTQPANQPRNAVPKVPISCAGHWYEEA